jgi:hypothetical protein
VKTLTQRKSARWLLAAARKHADAAAFAVKSYMHHLQNGDGAVLDIRRGERLEQRVRMGPNSVHAFVTHRDGSITNLGLSKNLLTNIGNMVGQGWFGGAIPAGGSGTPSTAVGATSITATGTPWTASNLATPQLGLDGFRVYSNAHTTTGKTVYGNIVSNTTSVATIDQWWTDVDGVGTTPTSGDGFIIGAGGIASVRFMGLTTNASAAAATDTTLASEITSGGCGRALATFARGSNPSGGSGTFTLQKVFSVTSSFTAIYKMGLFCCLTSAGADPMFFETVLNQAATVGNGDTLTVTDTITFSG